MHRDSRLRSVDVVSMVKYSNMHGHAHAHVEATIRCSAVWVLDEQFVPDPMRTAT